ncbi:MAG TPA: hypothetical protein VGR26_11405, partial [Acidimicrobiales bacterium]|nr:hypothetical protein [Acidimicrobiales bacterium]
TGARPTGDVAAVPNTLRGRVRQMPRGLRLAFCIVVAAGLAWFHERPVSAQPGDAGRHPAGEHLGACRATSSPAPPEARPPG